MQVLVPVLGKDIGLTKKDRNGDWVTYITTVDEATVLADKLAAAIVPISITEAETKSRDFS